MSASETEPQQYDLDASDQPTFYYAARNADGSAGFHPRRKGFGYGSYLGGNAAKFASFSAFTQKCFEQMGSDLKKLAPRLSKRLSQAELNKQIEASVNLAEVICSANDDQLSFKTQILNPSEYDELYLMQSQMRKDKQNSEDIRGYFCQIRDNVPVEDFSKQDRAGWTRWSRTPRVQTQRSTKPIYSGTAICRNIHERLNVYDPDHVRDFNRKYHETFQDKRVCPDAEMISTMAKENGFKIGVFTLSREAADKICFLQDPTCLGVPSTTQGSFSTGTDSAAHASLEASASLMDDEISEAVVSEILQPSQT